MRTIARVWILLALVSLPVAPQEPRSLAVSLGVFNVNKSPTPIEAGIEYRHPTGVWKMAAVGGAYANADAAIWGFGGLRRDFRLAERWWVTPAFGVALYSQGDSKNLGGPVEFRSAIELGREFRDRSRIALAFSSADRAGSTRLSSSSSSAWDL